MRKSFEINVRNFNDSARAFELAAEKAADTNALKMETARLETVVMWQIENAAYHRASKGHGGTEGGYPGNLPVDCRMQ